MAVSTTILIGVAASSLRARRQMQLELQMEQTRWLLQTAVIRAKKRCRASEDYEGETFDVSPSLTKHQSASVVIEVKNSTAEKANVSVTVKMIGAGLADQSTQRSTQLTVLR